MAKQVKVYMDKARETKRTFRFEEPGDDPTIGTLYVPKTVLADLGNPERISVTVAAEG